MRVLRAFDKASFCQAHFTLFLPTAHVCESYYRYEADVKRKLRLLIDRQTKAFGSHGLGDASLPGMGAAHMREQTVTTV